MKVSIEENPDKQSNYTVRINDGPGAVHFIDLSSALDYIRKTLEDEGEIDV